MKVVSFLVLVFILHGCGKEKQIISHNPFEPNYYLEISTVLANDFNLLYTCEGGVNVYVNKENSYDFYFFEDCNKPGKIIGEQYDFRIDSIEDYNWRKPDSLLIDFEKYKDTINYFLQPYYTTLLKPNYSKTYRKMPLQVVYLNDSIFDSYIACNPEGVLLFSIENWY